MASTARPHANRAWLPATAVGLVLVALGVTVFLFPQLMLLLKSASSVLRTEEVSSVRVFLGTWGHGSPLAVVALGVWQALAAPLPSEALIRAAADAFGPFVGGLLSWVGLTLGALACFAITRALVGVPIAAVRAKRGALPAPRGIAIWVLAGLRLIPFVPQDLVSYAFGATRVRWREYVAISALGALPGVVFFTTLAEEVPSQALVSYRLVSALIGTAILCAIGWRERTSIPAEHLSAGSRRRVAIGAVAVAVAVATYYFVPAIHAWVDAAVDVLGSGNVEYVRDYLLGFGVWAPVVSATLMILQSVLAPLPAFVVTFANGLLFGWAWGALLSWSSAMAGAALCFWIARSLGRPAVERLAGGSAAVEVSDAFFARYGDRTVLIARLLPFVSFDIISYGAGLTSMGFWRFFIATGIGQLPATLVYSYLGQNLTGSVRVLFLIFVFTAVVFVVGATVRPIFMRKLHDELAENGEGTSLPAANQVGS